MRLSDRLGRQAPRDPRDNRGEDPQQPPSRGGQPKQKEDLAGIAARLHPKIVERLDLAAVAQLAPEDLKQRLRVIVEQVVSAERLSINSHEAEVIIDSVLDELTGLGPLENLLKD